MARLTGKIAVITGGSSGIGLATAQRFVEEGCYVFITGRNKQDLDKAKTLIGENVTVVPGDVTNLSDIERLYAIVKESKGHLDIVFANAGVGDFTPLEAVTEDYFDAEFRRNVRGVLFTVQKALPLLKNGGSIIITGSIAGSTGIAGMSVYSATKAAVRSFARTWTMELKDRNIRTNVISPGLVGTRALEVQPPDAIAQSVALVPMARISAASEIAAAVAFLASSDSSYITGIELFADGGMAQV